GHADAGDERLQRDPRDPQDGVPAAGVGAHRVRLQRRRGGVQGRRLRRLYPEAGRRRETSLEIAAGARRGRRRFPLTAGLASGKTGRSMIDTGRFGFAYFTYFWPRPGRGIAT